VAPVFIDGEKAATLRGDDIARQFVAIIDDYVDRRYARADA
jgi:(E)-4-hydroxy-3-methylbut-2-enyl-diphosphate synthase